MLKRIVTGLIVAVVMTSAAIAVPFQDGLGRLAPNFCSSARHTSPLLYALTECHHLQTRMLR